MPLYILISCEENFEALCDHQIKKKPLFLSCIRKYREKDIYNGGAIEELLE